MSKKSKLYNDASQVMFEYYGGGGVPRNVTHVRFHPSVVNVRSEAFHSRKSLVEVVINDGLREMGESAFYGCSSLQSISIPSTITKIGTFVFDSCIGLEEVVLKEGLKEIGHKAFANCKALQSITIPSTVEMIDTSAFFSCTEMREVILNDGLKKIGGGAFQKCPSLERITIPSTVDYIEPWTFYDCTNLQDVVLNYEGLQKIDDKAFQNTSLEHITFPFTVAYIGNFAFWDCSSLREVVLHNEEVHIGYKAFTNCSSLERFKFPSLWNRLDRIIQAGQRDIESRMDDVSAIEWRGGELVIPTVRRQIQNHSRLMENEVNADKEKLNKVKALISFYEMKEATTLFELALWKARIDQAEDRNVNRNAHRIEVPGPVKDAILQYVR